MAQSGEVRVIAAMHRRRSSSRAAMMLQQATRIAAMMLLADAIACLHAARQERARRHCRHQVPASSWTLVHAYSSREHLVSLSLRPLLCFAKSKTAFAAVACPWSCTACTGPSFPWPCPACPCLFAYDILFADLRIFACTQLLPCPALIKCTI
jgi:hypothetical protein